MGRRWIGVEMGAHARTHCALRLTKVIDGEQGGISKDAVWTGGGGFCFFTLGEPVFAPHGTINPTIGFPALARHIWFSETRSPLPAEPRGPVLGLHGANAYALLFNGILRDRSSEGGNALTRATLAIIRADLARHAPNFGGPLVVYGASCRLSPATLARERVTFRQTPYDIKARA
jgi:adenine-specific DNA-methyltransferase